ncbi:unnamed protein product [Musa acuminata subsp. burmannicoides]
MVKFQTIFHLGAEFLDPQGFHKSSNFLVILTSLEPFQCHAITPNKLLLLDNQVKPQTPVCKIHMLGEISYIYMVKLVSYGRWLKQCPSQESECSIVVLLAYMYSLIMQA